MDKKERKKNQLRNRTRKNKTMKELIFLKERRARTKSKEKNLHTDERREK